MVTATHATNASPTPPPTPTPPPAFRTQVNQWLQSCWESSPPPDEPTDTRNRLDALPASDLQNLGLYLHKKGRMTVRDVKKSWGKNNGLNGEQVSELLLELINLNLIETFADGTSRVEWVRWLET